MQYSCQHSNLHRFLWLGIALVVAMLILVYYILDPVSSVIPAPQCWWHVLTGTSCPACGSQRALHALLHGHPLEAWSYNWLLPFGFLYFLLLLACEVFPSRTQRLHRVLHHHRLLYAVVVLFFLWWIGRNLLGV